MPKQYCCHTLVAMSLSAAVGLAHAQAPAANQKYPMLEPIVQKVVQTYQKSSCQQLWAKKAAGQTEMEKRAVQMMRQDQTLRELFLNQVSAVIVNKLFECGMIP